LGLQYGDLEFWEYWRICLFEVSIILWNFGTIFDVYDCAGSNFCGSEDEQENVFADGCRAIFFGDGG